MFPEPTPIPKGRCRDCGTEARLDRMVQGLGEKCARDAGLIGKTVNTGQTGPDLLDLLDEQDQEGR